MTKSCDRVALALGHVVVEKIHRISIMQAMMAAEYEDTGSLSDLFP